MLGLLIDGRQKALYRIPASLLYGLLVRGLRCGLLFEDSAFDGDHEVLVAAYNHLVSRLIGVATERLAIAFGGFCLGAGRDSRPYGNVCKHIDRGNSTISWCFCGSHRRLLLIPTLTCFEPYQPEALGDYGCIGDLNTMR